MSNPDQIYKSDLLRAFLSVAGIQEDLSKEIIDDLARKYPRREDGIRYLHNNTSIYAAMSPKLGKVVLALEQNLFFFVIGNRKILPNHTRPIIYFPDDGPFIGLDSMRVSVSGNNYIPSFLSAFEGQAKEPDDFPISIEVGESENFLITYRGNRDDILKAVECSIDELFKHLSEMFYMELQWIGAIDGDFQSALLNNLGLET